MRAARSSPVPVSRGAADIEHRGTGRLEDALLRCEQDIAQNPNYPAAYSRQGHLLQQLGRYGDAIASFDRAIALNPSAPLAHSSRGNALLALQRYAEALGNYDRAIALKPDDMGAYNNRGTALKNLGQLAEAVDSYKRAIALAPDRAELHNNLGNVLQELEFLEEAVASYNAAIRLNRDYAEAYGNRGVALHQLLRLDEAMSSFNTALLLKPDYPQAIFNRSLLYLHMGQFAAGWRDHEARRRTEIFAEFPNFAKPLWLGEADIEGKTILVVREQGYGDVIQFSRYVHLCKQAGARVLFAPQESLRTLMHGLDAEVQIVDENNDYLRFDFYCPLMSLPLAFKTEMTTIPPPSYISVDEEKIAAWARRLGKKTKPRIGVVWDSTSRFRWKVIPLEQFRRLFSSRFQFVSLQRHRTEAERARLDRAGVLHPGEALFDFSDTAALCHLMDLVITVDTSVAHLAGALGSPVWVLLPWFADWRWLLDREDSPWYPSMRLFRQHVRGDWDGVLRRVQLELEALFDREVGGRVKELPNHIGRLMSCGELE
jgi:tetratricopeptide (TPR) repeat protein